MGYGPFLSHANAGKSLSSSTLPNDDLTSGRSAHARLSPSSAHMASPLFEISPVSQSFAGATYRFILAGFEFWWGLDDIQLLCAVGECEWLAARMATVAGYVVYPPIGNGTGLGVAQLNAPAWMRSCTCSS